MIKVRFIKDAIWKANGKLIPKTTVIVMDSPFVDEYIEKGYAVPFTGNIPKELMEQIHKPRKKFKERLNEELNK